MRLFRAEMAKIWNWRVVAVIVTLCAGTFFALLMSSITSYSTFSGIYGDYQNQMYEAYSDTLEPDELADFDIPGKIDEMKGVVEGQMADNPLFAKYDIVTYDEWEAFGEKANSGNGNLDDLKPMQDDFGTMIQYLNGDGFYFLNGNQVMIGDWLDSPSSKVQELEALEYRYADINNLLWKGIDERPVVAHMMESFPDHATNLIAYSLTSDFASYAAIVGVLTILAVMILIAPVMAGDRHSKVHVLQYTSNAGRGIVRQQFSAMLVSAVTLSVAIVSLAWVGFLVGNGTGKYWSAHISDVMGTFWMYNITLGSFVLILAGMIIVAAVGTGCAAFALSLTSTSMVTMFVKEVPVAAAVSVLAAVSLAWALSSDNFIFNAVFKGHLYVPETGVPVIVGIIGVVVAVILVHRERSVDR